MTSPHTPPTPHAPAAPLSRTPLYDLHFALGAKMVPFAGYEMPVQYPPGVLKEHLWTREHAGLFDVSHMGQVTVRSKLDGEPEAAEALERLIAADVIGIPAGRQRYGLLTNDAGGILDDLMIINRGDHLLLIVNAARKDHDWRHLDGYLFDLCDIRLVDRALLALQGPKAEAALAKLAPACRDMRFMDVADVTLLGHDAIIVRAGYTGEDGYEISLANAAARPVAEALLADPDVAPIGLGARDSLRLEAGLCLYGSDIDETTSPIEASLAWAIGKRRLTEVPFPGSERIRAEARDGTSRRRVGLKPQGRAPVRAGTMLFASEIAAEPVGHVTSGGFGPSVDHPIAMGYVTSPLAKPGTPLFAEVRGKRLPVAVATLPFITPRYKRG
ncbi:MAG: glycine cleavage system aminomethyltransferase GcvT [Hyphomicrobiaceae bacterium]|nr:glycine cleavage system aminomethyltransferase GcvT [Hyphomicrobiaceae bacterium]